MITDIVKQSVKVLSYDILQQLKEFTNSSNIVLEGKFCMEDGEYKIELQLIEHGCIGIRKDADVKNVISIA